MSGSLTLPILVGVLSGIVTAILVLLTVRVLALRKTAQRAGKAQFIVRHDEDVRPLKWHKLTVLVRQSSPPEQTEQGRPDSPKGAEAAAGEARGDDQPRHVESQEESFRPIPNLSELTFAPMAEGVEFSPRSQTKFWKQDSFEIEFFFRAGLELSGRTAYGILRVYLGPILQAAVPLEFKLSGGPASEVEHKSTSVTTSALPFGKIFVSYSSKDSFIVNEHLQFARALGGAYVLDVLSLRAGENWNESLRDKIDEADAFQLFWSQNSMRSPFVKREWEHALSLGRQPFIYPTYWEQPLPKDEALSLPPPQLDLKHFQLITPPPRIFLYARVMQHAWVSFKAVSHLSIALLVLFVLSVMALTFWGVKTIVEVANTPPAVHTTVNVPHGATPPVPPAIPDIPPPPPPTSVLTPAPAPAVTADDSPAPPSPPAIQEVADFKTAWPAFAWGGGMMAVTHDDEVRFVDTRSGHITPSFKATDDPIHSVYFSKGADVAAVVSEESVNLLDTRSGGVIFTRPFDFRDDQVKLSPDGKMVAVATSDQLELWDLSSRRLMFKLPGPFTSPSVGFSPDGRTLFIQEVEEVRLWDLRTRRTTVFKGMFDDRRMGFSPDGKVLFLLEDDGNYVRLWDVAARREIVRIVASPDTFQKVLFSRDAKTLATVGIESLRLWDVRTGRGLVTLPGGFGESFVRFMSGDKVLAIGDRKSVALWDVTTARMLIPNLGGFSDPTTKLALTDEVLIAGPDRIRLWDVRARRERLTVTGGPPDKVEWVGFSADGKVLAVVGEVGLRLWHTQTRQELGTFMAEAAHPKVSISPDGKLVIGRVDPEGEPALRLWHVEDETKTIHKFDRDPEDVRFSFSPDGRALAIGGSDKLEVWDIASKGVAATLPGQSEMLGVAFSPGSEVLASTGKHNVSLWDTRTWQLIDTLTDSEGLIEWTKFSADGKVLAVVGGHTVRLWDVETRRVTQTFERQNGAGGSVTAPDGEIGAVVEDEVVKVSDTRSNHVIAMLSGPPAAIITTEVRPGGRSGVLIVSGEHGVTLWDVATGFEIATLPHWRAELDVGSSPGGKVIAIVSRGVIKLWDMEARRVLATFEGFEDTVRQAYFYPHSRMLLTRHQSGALKLHHVSLPEELKRSEKR